jgi:hypothetical protein
MKTTDILLIGAGGLLLAKAISSQKAKDEAGTWNPNSLPESTEGENGSGGVAFRSIPRGEAIDYKTWKAGDWLNYVRNLVAKGESLEQALSTAYNRFQNPENLVLEYVPTFNAFIMYIARSERIPSMMKAEVAGIGNTNTVTWDSQPLYDNFDAWANGLPTWSCADWIEWHKALERHYNSTSKANQVWVQAWNSPNHNPDCWSFMCPDTSYCRYDCQSFVNYLASKDLPVGNLLSNVTCDLSNIVLNITEGAASASQSINLIMKLLPFAGVYLGYRYLKNKKLI